MADAVIICENYQGCRAITLKYGRTFRYDLRRDDKKLRESKLGQDLLAVAGVVMIADRAFRRRFRLGEFTRTYHIRVSVNRPGLWEAAAGDLVQALSFLSSDNWKFTFIKRDKGSTSPLQEESPRQREMDVATLLEESPRQREMDVATLLQGRSASVALFSGGLDSFCGAAHLLKQQRRQDQNGFYPVFLSSYAQELSRLQELLDKLFHKAYRFSIDADIDPIISELNQNKISKGLQSEFGRNNYSLSRNAIARKESSRSWTIKDGEKGYILKKEKDEEKQRDKLNIYCKAYVFSIDAEINPIISELNQNKISKGLQSEFDRNNYSLSRNAIARKESSRSWTIKDGEKGYILKKEKDEEKQRDKLNIYPNSYLHVPIYFRASPKKIVIDGRPLSALPERTRRTRSFFYMAQAAAFALSHNIKKIYVFENGVLALNLPIRSDRTGARSTRHAHPVFLDAMQSFLRRLSQEEGSPEIVNPFALDTKAQILRHAAKWPDLIGETVSCWGYGNFTATLRRERKDVVCKDVGRKKEDCEEVDCKKECWQDITHCGFCLPCLVRRLALKSAKDVDDAPSIYAYDVFQAAEEGFPPPEKRKEQWAEAKALLQFAQELEKLDKWEFYHDYIDNLVHLDPLDHKKQLSKTYEMMGQFAKDVKDSLGGPDE